MDEWERELADFNARFERLMRFFLAMEEIHNRMTREEEAEEAGIRG
jgi:hypothetical protein